METKENVYEGTAKTEQGTEREKGSAVLGKFKSVDALSEAYGALQAEFTRRSQRLKVLERELSKVREGKETADAVFPESATESEEVAPSKTQEADNDLPFDKKDEEPTEGEISAEETGTESAGAERGVSGGAGESAQGSETGFAKAEEGERVVETYSEERLFEEAMKNESVRLKIIGEYLSSIGKTGAPLLSGGRGTLGVSVAKAKTVADAGNMALQLFRKAKEQA